MKKVWKSWQLLRIEWSNELIITQKHIEDKILNIRGVQVMIDYHLAELYNETKE